MELVSTVTVGSGGASSIQFTSIPQTGNDLILLLSLRQTNTTNGATNLAINNASANSGTFVQALGTSVSGGTGGNTIRTLANPSGSLSDTFSNGELFFFNYSKTQLRTAIAHAAYETNSTSGNQIQFSSGGWSSTAAITSISVTAISNGTFLQNSVASLYIRK